MTLTEALKTGRPIRRRTRAFWHRYSDFMGDMTDYICDPTADQWMDPNYFIDTIRPDREDLLADDWEVKDIPVEVTRAQFWEAYKAELQAFYAQRHALNEVPRAGDIVSGMAKRLGFND